MMSKTKMSCPLRVTNAESWLIVITDFYDTQHTLQILSVCKNYTNIESKHTNSTW